MNKDFFSLYDMLISGVSSDEAIAGSVFAERWTMVKSRSSVGLAMSTRGNSIPPMFPAGMESLPLSMACRAVKSWNFEEASLGLAALNSFYNSPEKLSSLGCAQPMSVHYTHSLDFSGKTVGLIGHLKGPEHMRDQAKAVYIIEKEPQPGDYPDSACDYILPMCDIVIITGSSLVNKTLPHLLELCRDAYTILTGPSVPMCPELLDYGVDRISGLVVTDFEAISEHVVSGKRGSPYYTGESFIISR